MASEIIFQMGDLLEYTREFPGHSDLPDRMTVRGIVRGFEVSRPTHASADADDTYVSVWLYEGAEQLGEPTADTIDGVDVTVTEGRIDRPRELVAFGLDYLISIDPEVVRRGVSPRELDNFIVGSHGTDTTDEAETETETGSETES